VRNKSRYRTEAISGERLMKQSHLAITVSLIKTVAMSYNNNVSKAEVEFGKDLVFW
jgi:hypothetical protein